MMIEKNTEGQRELRCVCLDLEKAYDRGLREELWCGMRKPGVAEKYVRVVQDMYESCKTVVKSVVGVEGVEVKGGGETASRISSEPLLVSYVDGQTDR